MPQQIRNIPDVTGSFENRKPLKELAAEVGEKEWQHDPVFREDSAGVHTVKVGNFEWHMGEILMSRMLYGLFEVPAFNSNQKQ